MTATSWHYSDKMPDETNSSGIFRYALGIQYKGTAYHGWQRQESRSSPLQEKSVQGELEAALARVANHTVMTVCAGRTDSGVHGCEQVIHFDTSSIRPLKAWVLGVNSHLPPDVSILWAHQVVADFHARFSAVARTYRYVICNRPDRPAIARELATWVHEPLQVEQMHEAAQSLLGENDFSSFRGASCQSRTPWRFVEFVRVRRQKDWVLIDIKANAFVHHMVRNIVGALLEVGKGRHDVAWMAEVLAARDRNRAAATAPAQGLYLLRVDYPTHYGLPQRPDSGELLPL